MNDEREEGKAAAMEATEKASEREEKEVMPKHESMISERESVAKEAMRQHELMMKKLLIEAAGTWPNIYVTHKPKID